MSTELRPSTENSIDQPPPEKILNEEVHFTIESWVNYTGLKIKEHNEQELEAFKKPFLIGWQRELSIRAQLHSSGKRIVDISYISPCKQTRLKSYIELGVYLRNDQSCQLEPENFTFAKQPVYKYPEEIIKQLIKVPKPATSRSNRSSNRVTENGGTRMPQLTPYDESRELNSSMDSSLNNSITGIAEGRSKRKRTAPTRFDDEDYLESLNKKKLIKTTTTTSQSIPTTPSKLNNSTSSITSSTGKTSITPFSPKNEINKKNDKQHDTSEDKESNSSFKSSKSRLSDQHNKQQLNVQLDNNELDNDTINNLKENELDSKNKISENSETIEQQQKTDQPAPRQKRKYVRTKPRDPNSANSLLMNQVNNILQNGNFECEDNDLSDCEMNLPVPLLNNDQLLPIPPCSLICGQNEGDLPTLLCSKCLCLFHPHCVKTGIFLKETKEFVCPNCMQPDDLDNAIEDSTILFEQANDNEMNNETNHECLISESSNQSMTSNQPILNQQLNKLSSIKITKYHTPKYNIISGKTFIPNRSDNNNLTNIKTNGLDNKKSKQIRLPTNLIRNLSNLSNSNNNNNLSATMINSSNKTKINQQKNLNQLLDKSQLIKTINQLDSRQQDLKNLRSNYNQLANGMQTNSSFASRKTHLDSMNKSIQSSKELLEIFKKVTASAGYLNGQMSNRNQIMMMNRNNNNNIRLNQLKNDNLQQSREQTSNYQSSGYYDSKLNKYYDYLNQKQTGLRQMIDQYQALDKIFDYLSVRDLIQCKLVNKTFNRLTNEKHHWKKLNLKNLIVNDWKYFSSKIVDDNQSEELCLENLRLPNRQQTPKTEKELRNELWKEFRDNYQHFQTLNRINFGKISINHLNYLLTNVNENEDFSNPLYDLEELSIKNIYDDDENVNDNNQTTIESNFVSLKKLDQLIECKNLRYLRIESKQGISNDESTINFLNNLSEALPQLKQLYLPSLRGFTLENFEFLIKLNQLEVLEIGSCESWTSGLMEEDEEIDLDNNLEDNQSSNAENSNDELIEINKKRNSIRKHKGAFKYLSQLRNLKKLHLVDVIIDEMECNQLPICLENMSNLESLGLSCTVSPDATQTLNMLCNTLKTKLLNLKSFQISTEDPHTNKTVFELLLKRLNNLQELKWLVGTQVEDNGECLVPFIKERGMESDLENEDNLDLTVENDCIERFETCYLNDILHKQLNNTKIFILPQ